MMSVSQSRFDVSDSKYSIAHFLEAVLRNISASSIALLPPTSISRYFWFLCPRAVFTLFLLFLLCSLFLCFGCLQTNVRVRQTTGDGAEGDAADSPCGPQSLGEEPRTIRRERV